jgi:branched-chain amino acid aminotransferase
MEMVFNNGEIGEISQKMYDIITGVQFGKMPDDYNWMLKI